MKTQKTTMNMYRTMVGMIAALAIFFSACNNAETTDDTENLDTLAVSEDGVIETVVVEGTYKGTLPCADCEGVETTIIFKEDNTYNLDAKYLGKDGAPFQYSGSYTVSGQTITLDGITDGPAKYHIEGDDIVQLDIEGKKIEHQGDQNYTLEKQE